MTTGEGGVLGARISHLLSRYFKAEYRVVVGRRGAGMGTLKGQFQETMNHAAESEKTAYIKQN